MDQCCPSPDYPVIQPDQRAVKLRRILKQLYYGQAMICFIKLLLYGGLAGIFQLINLWVIYTAFATMHFCSVLIYLIMSSFDLLFAVMDWQRYEAAMKDKESSKFVQFLFVVQIVYFIIAIVYSFKAYGHFKQLFFLQVGQYGAGGEANYRRGPGGDSSDEERDNAYQRQQRAMREQFQRQQQNHQQQQLIGMSQQNQQNNINMPNNNAQNQGAQGYPPLNRQGTYQPPQGHVAPIVQHDFTKKLTMPPQSNYSQNNNSSAANNALQTVATLRNFNNQNNNTQSTNSNNTSAGGQGFNAFGGQGHRIQ